MFDRPTFIDLISRIRHGDEDAAGTLLRHYEPIVRREIRLRILDHRISRRLDPADLCQDTLASFLIRTAAGDYDLSDPQDATRLIVVMVRHKIASAMRHERSQCRDLRREEQLPADYFDSVAGLGPSPSENATIRELSDRALRALGPEERQIRELRDRGCQWGEIAHRLGGTPDARRLQLTRALSRIAKVLGFGTEVVQD